MATSCRFDSGSGHQQYQALRYNNTYPVGPQNCVRSAIRARNLPVIAQSRPSAYPGNAASPTADLQQQVFLTPSLSSIQSAYHPLATPTATGIQALAYSRYARAQH